MILREHPNDSMTTPEGDKVEEFEAAFRQVSRSAFLLARQLGRGTDEALDIVQEAALRGWRHRATRRGDFKSWFLAIVYRQARNSTPNWLSPPACWERSATHAVWAA